MSEDAINEFLVESVFPSSSDETTVTGFVAKGSLYTGQSVSLRSADGTPLLAPIRRIGSSETPINVVREGQKTTLLLAVEPQLVVPGSRLTCRGEDVDNQATAIISSDAIAGQAQVEITDNASLAQARTLIDQRSFEDAKTMIDDFTVSHSDNCASHFLLSRIALEADCELHEPLAALGHAKKAYELGGSEDPEVLETLAIAMGMNGQASHGIRHLERLFERAREMDQRTLYEERIEMYRKRFKIADSWEFLDEFGAIVYQSSDLDDITKAIKNGSIPNDSDCRKNKHGKLLELKEFIQTVDPDLRSQLSIPTGGGRVLDIALGASAGLLVAILMDMIVGASPILSAAVAAVAGTVVVLGLHKQRQTTVH